MDDYAKPAPKDDPEVIRMNEMRRDSNAMNDYSEEGMRESIKNKLYVFWLGMHKENSEKRDEEIESSTDSILSLFSSYRAAVREEIEGKFTPMGAHYANGWNDLKRNLLSSPLLEEDK